MRPDEAAVEDDEEEEEIREEEKRDEMAGYFRKDCPPKVAVTTSEKPTSVSCSWGLQDTVSPTQQ